MPKYIPVDVESYRFTKCPNCGFEAEETEEKETIVCHDDFDGQSQTLDCKKCGASWSENFTLTSVTMVRPEEVVSDQDNQ